MLRELIKEMLAEAQAQPNKPIVKKLKGNLHLKIIYQTNDLTFAIARDSILPSAQEWQTCIQYFPYFVGNPQPTPGTDTMGRLELKATLPHDKKIVMF